MLQYLELEHLTRRHFLSKCSMGLGGLWLASQGQTWGASAAIKKDPAQPLLPDLSHFAPKAKRVIYLHMAGSPSQLEMFDFKPELAKLDGKHRCIGKQGEPQYLAVFWILCSFWAAVFVRMIVVGRH